jgi:predicted dehydrogenase
VALVGVGRFGRHHLRILRTLTRAGMIDFAGVVARSAGRAHAIAARFGVPAYPSLDRAFEAGVCVVDIVTPAATHASLIRQCLTSAEAARCYALARRHHRTLAVGHIYRFNPAIRYLRRHVRRGARPLSIRIELTGQAPPPGDVGAIINYLHVFDVVDELLSQPPVSTECLAMQRQARTRFERHAILALRYPSNLPVVIEVGWVGGQKRRLLEMLFPRARIRCDLARHVVQIDRGSRPAPRVIRFSRREPLRVELEHFFRCLQRDVPPRPAPATVLHVMRMVGDAERSMRLGRPVQWRP